MEQIALEAEHYGYRATKFDRDRVKRDLKQIFSLIINQEGGYYQGVGHMGDQSSEFGAADNYSVPNTDSVMLPGPYRIDDQPFTTEDQTSNESEPWPSLIEEFPHYFRKKTIEKELRGYLRLEERWGGVESVAPPELAVENTISFLSRFPDDLTQPTPMVAADGEVGLYWRHQSAYVELEFAGDGMMFGYARDLNGKETFFDDVPLDSAIEMEKAIATVSKIVVQFPRHDDQDR